MSKDGSDLDDAIRASQGIASLIKAAGDSESGKSAARNIGDAAVTLTSTINNVLLPLAAVNYAFDKARIYFSERFSNDMEEAVERQDSNEFCEPDSSFANQALQGLAMVHEDESLKNMYLNLLAGSITASHSGRAHPAFVDVLKQITPFEAQLMGGLLAEPTTAIARIVLVNPDFKESDKPKLKVPVRQHLLNVIDSETGELYDDERIELMIDSFFRLGLIEVCYGDLYLDKSHFDWAVKHPAFLSYYYLGEEDGVVVSDDKKHKFRVGIEYGVARITVFGNRFSMAAGLNAVRLTDNHGYNNFRA